MKENSQEKGKRKSGFITCNGIETHWIPPSIKRKARVRKVHIWTRPFKCGLSSATDEVISENPEKVAFNQRLTKTQIEVINRAVGSESMGHIKSFLIQTCNVPDPTNLTWREILAHLEVYLHSQKAEQPAATEQNATPAKPERENWLWKLYEKTLKVIVDTVLDRVWPK